MEFEAKVLDKVAEVIGDEYRATFYGGSLFVICSAENAHRIKKELRSEIVTCNVKMCKVGNEYAYDFVA